MRLDHSLVLRGCEVRDVQVITLAQRRQDIVAAVVGGGEREVAMRDLESR